MFPEILGSQNVSKLNSLFTMHSLYMKCQLLTALRGRAESFSTHNVLPALTPNKGDLFCVGPSISDLFSVLPFLGEVTDKDSWHLGLLLLVRPSLYRRKASPKAYITWVHRERSSLEEKISHALPFLAASLKQQKQKQPPRQPLGVYFLNRVSCSSGWP